MTEQKAVAELEALATSGAAIAVFAGLAAILARVPQLRERAG